jgi:hypothetical protein
MREMNFADTRQRREREKMTLFTFLDLCEGKRQKKKAYYLYFFFFGKLILFYYELSYIGALF